jgi:hypothetical protein
VRQKGFAPILILVLIALVVVGYFGYKNYWSKMQSFVIPTPIATADPTANWKKYMDPSGNFSFKYPLGMFAETQSTEGSVNIFQNESQVKTKCLVSVTKECTVPLLYIVYKKIQSTDYKNDQDFIDNITHSAPGYTIVADLKYSDGTVWEVTPALGAGWNSEYVAYIKSGNIYNLVRMNLNAVDKNGIRLGSFDTVTTDIKGDGPETDISYQILSTFKFTQ